MCIRDRYMYVRVFVYVECTWKRYISSTHFKRQLHWYESILTCLMTLFQSNYVLNCPLCYSLITTHTHTHTHTPLRPVCHIGHRQWRLPVYLQPTRSQDDLQGELHWWIGRNGTEELCCKSWWDHSSSAVSVGIYTWLHHRGGTNGVSLLPPYQTYLSTHAHSQISQVNQQWGTHIWGYPGQLETD